MAGWGSNDWGSSRWGSGSSSREHIPTSPEFPSADVNSLDTISILPDYIEVSTTKGAPWIVYDPVALGLRVMNDGGAETAISIDLETSESWTLEVTFRPDKLPPDLSNLDLYRFFIGAYDMQGPGCGLAISRAGLAILPAPVGSAFPIPGSQSLIPEGSDYYTVRIAVSAELDVTNIYVTKTSLIPIKGHQLRFTTGAIQAPTDSSDGVIIDPLGTGPIPVQITLQTVRFNGHSMLIPNQRPVAVPGKDQGVSIGATVQFDGSGSYDPEGSPLTYFWSLIDVPDGSQFKISGTDGNTTPDFNNDGFTYFFSALQGAFNVDNAPVLQPGDTLVVGGQQYTVAVGVVGQTPMWVMDLITSKWVRNPDLEWNQTWSTIAITAELLPDNLSNQSWFIYHSATFFDDQTHAIPVATPDAAGLYEPQLVVNDGELDSIPEFALLNVAQTSLTMGVIPDVSFVWNHLSNFWNLLEDKDKAEVVWSGFAQAAANILMTAWQIDYNKSLKDIQRVFQKRWLEYGLLLEDDPSTAIIRIVRGPILSDNLYLGAPVGGRTLELLFDGGRAETITFTGDLLVNLSADEIARQINEQIGFSLASVVVLNNDPTQYWNRTVQIQLNYPTLLQVSPHGTANVLFRFSTTTYTQNNINGPGVEYNSYWAVERTTPKLSTFIRSGYSWSSPGPYSGLSGTTLDITVSDWSTYGSALAVGSVTFTSPDPISASQAAAEIMASMPFIIAADDGTGRLWLRNTFVQNWSSMRLDGSAVDVLSPDPNISQSWDDDRWFDGPNVLSGVTDHDMLVHKGIGYRIREVLTDTYLDPSSLDNSILQLAEHMSYIQWSGEWLPGKQGYALPWCITSTITSTKNNFTEQLVAVGDLASFAVEDIATGETVEVLCNIIGVSQNCVGFDPVPLLAKYGGHVDQYNVGFIGVRRLHSTPLDSSILEIPRLQEIIKDPTSFFTQNKDFLIQEEVSSKHGYDIHYPIDGGPVPKEATRYAITFIRTPYTLLDPPPDSLWAEITYLDNRPAVEANFGTLVTFTSSEASAISSSLDYLSAVRGLWYAYFGGPSIENVRIGIQILLGLPFAEEAGIVDRIDPHFSATQGRIFLRDVSNPAIVRGYFYPTVAGLGLAPNIAAKTKIEQFAPLSTGVDVLDWVNGADWLVPYRAVFSEVEKFFRFAIRANIDAFDLANFMFAIDFILKFKPHYTFPTFIILKNITPADRIDVLDELTTVVRKLIVSTPDTKNIGAYRYDDDIDGGAFNPPHSLLYTDGECLQQFDGPSYDKPYFGFDRPLLFPGTQMFVLASDTLSGPPKFDSIWAYDDGGGTDIVPFSGPAPTPPPPPYGPLVGQIQFDMGQEGGSPGLPTGVYSREWYL